MFVYIVVVLCVQCGVLHKVTVHAVSDLEMYATLERCGYIFPIVVDCWRLAPRVAFNTPTGLYKVEDYHGKI
jgi:hypothetical protein